MTSPLCEHVVDLLAGWGPVTYRAMFGGFGLFRDGRIFAIVADETLFLKADAGTLPHLAAEGSIQFAYEARGRTMRMAYWSAPEAFFESPEEAARWAALAMQAADRAVHPTPRRRRARLRGHP